MIIPKFLYKGFDKEEHAILFIEKGKFRLGLIQYYKNIEDANRRDKSEGRSESIVKKYLPGFTLRLVGFHGNPLYLFCTSGPNVDLDIMKRKWPYIVKITDPEKLRKSLCEIKPINTKMETTGRCMLKKVSYTKGEVLDIDPDSSEAVTLTYIQKPMSFEEQCEFRYIVTTLPPLDHIPELFLKYNIGKKIDYASFV
jgi:hypothetical protein